MHVSDHLSLLLLDRFATTMVRSITCRLPIVCRIGLCLLMLAGCLSLVGSACAASGARPDFAVISQTVADYFNSIPDQQPNDLINRSQVEEVLDAVADVGWDVPDRNALVERALADGSFLVGELAKPAGRKFMRGIARYPGTYSRLDRLSTISGGKQLVRDFIRRPGGYEFIEYLATTQSGHNMGTMMAGVQHGVDLNKPTGRIYTANDLIAALKTIYEKTTP
jgi:hypothetical protein